MTNYYLGYVMGRTSGTGVSQPIAITTLAELIASTDAFSNVINQNAYTINVLEIGSIILSFSDNLTAQGASQSTALALQSAINNVTSAAAGSGVILPLTDANGDPVTAGYRGEVWNISGTNIQLYPPIGHQLMTLGVNNPITVASEGHTTYVYRGNASWLIG